jgi:lipid-A-disaccharide synthase
MDDRSSEKRKIYFIVGESSGDALAADLIDSFSMLGHDFQFMGLAGEKMQARGVKSLFDISSISIMGLSGVIVKLPSIYSRISRTVRDIADKQPDAIVLVDSPEFSFRVARRVKARFPEIPIIKYVCPSVWAWRPKRAGTMKSYLDHILAILPFEPELLDRLGGPSATYIGHPLAWELRGKRRDHHNLTDKEKTVLLLPGSRRSEVRLLLPDIADTLAILVARNKHIRAVLPAVPHLADEIRAATEKWPVPPEIVIGEEGKLEAFDRADVALAASGTVLLELALHNIPMVSIYRLDWLMQRFRFLITGWSAALPNLITDETIIPERMNDMIRPGWLARELEALMCDGLARERQLVGFRHMQKTMQQEEAPGILAARKIISMMHDRP